MLHWHTCTLRLLFLTVNIKVNGSIGDTLLILGLAAINSRVTCHCRANPECRWALVTPGTRQDMRGMWLQYILKPQDIRRLKGKPSWVLSYPEMTCIVIFIIWHSVASKILFCNDLQCSFIAMSVCLHSFFHYPQCQLTTWYADSGANGI